MDVPHTIQVNEKSALLGNHTRSSSSQAHGTSVASITDRDADLRTRPPMRRIFWVIAAILASLLAIFSLLLLSIQPLSHIHRPSIQLIDAHPYFYGLHMSLSAQNSNLVKVVIQDADLDVLASAGESLISHLFLGNQRIDAEKNRTSKWHTRSFISSS
jgi:hypothetical protein